MADLPKSNYIQYAHLSRLSIDELMNLLVIAPIPASTPEEMAYVDALKEAIIKRETIHPTGILPDADKAWAEFQEQCEGLEDVPLSVPQQENVSTVKLSRRSPTMNPSSGSRSSPRRRLRYLLAAAVIVMCLVAFALPPALGYSSFFQMLGAWTSETFYFTPNEVPPAEAPAEESPSRKEYQSLQEALDDYGVTEQLVPSWIPDGYVLEEVSALTSPLDGRIEFRAVYQNENVMIFLRYVKRSTITSSIYERDENEVKIYEAGGIQHYILENLGQIIGTWYNGDVECSIRLDSTIEDLQKIIDSIYEE